MATTQKVHAVLRAAGFMRSERTVKQYRYNGPKFGGWTNGYSVKKDGDALTVHFRALSDLTQRDRLEEMAAALREKGLTVEHASVPVGNSLVHIPFLIVR